MNRPCRLGRAPATPLAPPPSLHHLLPACRDSEQFPEVLSWRAELAEVERQLDALLVGYRKQLQISNLHYISLQVGGVGGWGWGVLRWGRIVMCLPALALFRSALTTATTQHHTCLPKQAPSHPACAHQLHVTTCAPPSPQNQGEYLLEVPTDLVRRVPKEWEKVRGRPDWRGRATATATL